MAVRAGVAGLAVLAGLTVPLTVATPAAAGERAQTLAYVANFDDDTVSVIDTRTKTVITTIPVGDAPTGVAITPDGRRVYVTNAGDDTVSVINTKLNAVISTLQVGDSPQKVAIGTIGKDDKGKDKDGQHPGQLSTASDILSRIMTPTTS